MLMFVCFWHNSPQWARASSFTRFLDHIHWCTTVGRTLLDEWSARLRDLYLTTHTTLTTDKCPCPRWGFEPTISAAERPQIYALNCVATGTGFMLILQYFLAECISWLLHLSQIMPCQCYAFSHFVNVCLSQIVITRTCHGTMLIL